MKFLTFFCALCIIVCNIKSILRPRGSLFKLKVENGKLKIENCGRADSLQNANHCRPTVFVYIEVAFKCRGEPYTPASNGTNYMLKQIL